MILQNFQRKCNFLSLEHILGKQIAAYVDKSNQPFNLTNQSPLKEVKRSPISSTNLDWMGLDHL